MKIIELDEIDSTNEYAKRAAAGEDLIVTARRQTAGRGTKGRSFVSGDGGLYLSVLRYYDNFPAALAFGIMVNNCVAVCRTLEHFGLRPQIRWANDVLVNNKKISGTLIENVFGGGKVVRSVVGIGVNVNNRLPDDLKNIAVTMREACNKNTEVDDVKHILIENLQKEYTVGEYKSYIGYFGREVTIITDGGARKAVALDVSDDGRLKIREDGGEEKFISSAEVGLRL